MENESVNISNIEKPEGDALISYTVNLNKFRNESLLGKITASNVANMGSDIPESLKQAKDLILFALKGVDDVDQDVADSLLGELETSDILDVSIWGCGSCGTWWYYKEVNGRSWCPKC